MEAKDSPYDIANVALYKHDHPNQNEGWEAYDRNIGLYALYSSSFSEASELIMRVTL